MGGMSLSLVAQARRAGLPSAAFVHDDWLVYGPHVDAWLRGVRRAGPLARAMWRATGIPTWFAPGEVDAWLFVSAATRCAAERAVGALGGARVAHSGIHAGFLDPQPASPWRWRLLYVGRIDARKGIDTAVDALAGLPREATLTVIGAGDERHLAELRARAGARVAFAGPHDRDALKRAYADADVVLFPVRWEEPWGLVPLEAMAMGRPVVATGRGGSAEYLRDGENALFFDAGDAPGLAAAVRRLAGDEHLRARLREGGLRTAPCYTEAAFHAAVADALAALARDRAPRVA